MIGSASPCLTIVTSSPPHSWSCWLKSPASTTSTTVPALRLTSVIASFSLLHVSRSACGSPPGMYTDTTNTRRSCSRMIAAVKSGDSIRTCSASTSLLTHSMLRIGHLPSRQVDGTILVHL